MITMNEQWVVLLIQSNLHNRVHDCIRDLNPLCPLHFDYVMAYGIRRHEIFELNGQVVLNEGAAHR
jgi:hypothetical protein